MPGRITGVSRTSLWQSWKEVRTDARRSTIRDVVDFLDYDIEPNVWIQRLLHQIKSGAYEPQIPLRYTLAKSGGFKRRLALPAIPDLVLFRSIADYVHRKAQRYQQPHVYYRRTDVQQASEAAAAAARRDLQEVATIYKFTSRKSLKNWKDYEQYRKHLILKKLFRYIVVTDITNFFDSVLHSEVANAFRSYPVPSRLIGLLFFLLERLAIRADYCDSPRIGLPTDEFECSRTIANLVLFPHDRRMTALVGRDGYVRWMDDQVIGVNSKARALNVVAEVGSSLSSLYLSANAKKTRILSLAEAKVYFHLETNARLDAIETKIKNKTKARRALVRDLTKIWRSAIRHRGIGEWEKIQKRVYRLAGLTRAKFLTNYAQKDLLTTPMLSDRIADYMRATTSPRNYVRFVEKILRHKEQVHADVELILLENLLRLETKGRNASRVSTIATRILREIVSSRRGSVFATPACLLLLRFARPTARRQTLRYCFNDARPGELIRASAICYATHGRKAFGRVKKTAAVLLNNPLALMVRMVKRLQTLKDVPERFKARLNIRWDSVEGRNYLDMRTFVAARLLALNRRKAIRLWLEQWVRQSQRKGLSSFDHRLIQRITA